MIMKFPLSTLARVLPAALVAWAPPAIAASDDFWLLQGSVLTRHFASNGQYNNHQDLVGLERNLASGWLAGGATCGRSTPTQASASTCRTPRCTTSSAQG